MTSSDYQTYSAPAEVTEGFTAYYCHHVVGPPFSWKQLNLKVSNLCSTSAVFKKKINLSFIHLFTI